LKTIVFTKNDFIGNVAYSAGEICGWPDHIADRLIAKGFAKLHGGDGKVKEVGGRIPGAKDHWTNVELEEHVAALKRDGKWTPAPPIVVLDPEVQRAARERARDEMNQI
jgi:hypothetical protein